MSKQSAARITQANGRLRAKTPRMPEKEFSRLLTLAEASVTSLGAAYADSVAQSAGKLSDLSAAALSDEPSRQERLEKLRDLSFELRGEGGSFGCDVVSQPHPRL